MIEMKRSVLISHFRDLAQGLASRGIAVLRYEKRTKHHRLKMTLISGGLTVKEETIDDAVAAVNTLAEQPRIDADRIFVLGHSLGGNLLPRIGGASNKIAGFISFAGSVRPLEDLVLDQVNYLFSLDGTVTTEEQQKLDAIKKQVEKVKSPELSEEVLTSELPLGVSATYWLDLRGYNPAQSAKTLHKPFLILQGERDYQVTMVDFNLWKQALRSRDDVTLITYPRLNHLFMTGAGKSTPSEYLTPGNVEKTRGHRYFQMDESPEVGAFSGVVLIGRRSLLGGCGGPFFAHFLCSSQTYGAHQKLINDARIVWRLLSLSSVLIFLSLVYCIR